MASLHRSRHGLADLIAQDRNISSLDIIFLSSIVSIVAVRDPAHDLPNQHVKDIARSAYRELPRATGMAPLNDIRLDSVLDGILGAQPGGAIVTDVIGKGLRSTHMTEWSIPRIKKCLACGCQLQLQRTSNHPMFYSMFKPGCEGTVYRRHCPGCKLTYQEDGYQKDADLKVKDPRAGLKLPYPPDLVPQKWIPTSSETCVSVELITLQLGTVHLLHGSSQATCTLNAWMILSEAKLASGGKQIYTVLKAQYTMCTQAGPHIMCLE